jgi:hypothetical protein
MQLRACCGCAWLLLMCVCAWQWHDAAFIAAHQHIDRSTDDEIAFTLARAHSCVHTPWHTHVNTCTGGLRRSYE